MPRQHAARGDAGSPQKSEVWRLDGPRDLALMQCQHLPCILLRKIGQRRRLRLGGRRPVASAQAACIGSASALVAPMFDIWMRWQKSVRLSVCHHGPWCQGHFAGASPVLALALGGSLFRELAGGAGGGTRTPTGKALRIFLPATAFAAALRRLGSGLSLHRFPRAGVRCCPSSLYTFPFPGLARDCHSTGFPEFEQFYVAGFPARTQFWLKSVASTNSTTPA